MRVLIGCEYSGRVRQAFRDLGHEAWSCDMLESEDGSPYHIIVDVIPMLNDNWDIAIFHPPCTHLAVSGARHFARKASVPLINSSPDHTLCYSSQQLPFVGFASF